MNTISLEKFFKHNRSAKGAAGEKSLAKALRAQGFKVTRLHNNGYDLEITSPNGRVSRIECKIAFTGKDGKYRATTIKCGKHGQTDHRKSDFIILLCQEKFKGGSLTPFIIPCDAQGNKSHIAITSCPSTYNGRYAEYRNNWSVLQ